MFSVEDTTGNKRRRSDMAFTSFTPDMTDGLLKMLECRVCHSTMKPPIVQCMMGHNICSSCDAQLASDPCPVCRQKRTEVRNLLAEEMCQRILYPCENSGCTEKHLLQEMARHEANCSFRLFDCPINNLCLWKGMLSNILKHAESSHGTSVWREESTRTTSSDFSDNFIETTLVTSLGEVFVWHSEFSYSSSRFYGALKYIGPLENATKYTYLFKMSKDSNKQNVKVRNMVLKETDSFSEVFQQMDSCVVLDFNTIIKRFIGGTRLSYQLIVKRCE